MSAARDADGADAARGGRLRLVVLGCGFGGYSLLARRASRGFERTLVTPRNYFLFTPLLASAVSGTVEFRSILEPARRRLPGVRVLEAEVEAIDFTASRVDCVSSVTGERYRLEYDFLVISVGARTNDYGIPGVAQHTLKLADIEDARTIRRALLETFAAASTPGLPDAEVRRRLTFAVCGGGPTGVEVAAEIQDLLTGEIRRLYPELAGAASVHLYEATGRILSGFDEALAEYTGRHFTREGIELRTEAPVEWVEEGRLWIKGGSAVDCGLIVWAGGNRPVELVESLRIPKIAGRLVVDDRLRLQGREREYAIGDCAALGDPPLPATAQVAQQQGKYLAAALRERVGAGEPPPFRFRPFGMLAYVGAGRALADLPHAKWSGRTAWLFWRSVYLTKLVSFSNKVKVLFDWAKARLFGRDLSRI